MNEKIFVVSSDRAISDVIQLHMEAEGYICYIIAKASKALAKYQATEPDLVIIDLDTQTPDPLRLASAMQSIKPVPVIYLTNEDKQQGICLDIVTTGAAQLAVSNIDKLLNLVDEHYTDSQQSRARAQSTSVYQCGDLRANLYTKEVWIRGQKIHLSVILRDLLIFMIKNEDNYITKQELYQNVWKNPVSFNNNTIMAHIRNLRNKIQDDTHKYIFTKRGVGYMFSCRYTPGKKL